VAVLLLTSFVGLGRPLYTPDEPREAEISREMLLSPGVVPALNGHAFIEKPPLYYLAVAGVFRLTGEVSPASARLVSALSAFFTLLLVFLWGRRAYSTAVGVAAAVGLATSARFLISAHWILSDPLLMLFTTAALWSGWEATRKGGLAAAVCFYTSLVLALWTKGLIGPVLVGSGLAVYCGVYFRDAPWRQLRPVAGSAVMIAATALLGYAIYRSSGTEAVREWFWVNHVLRFVAPDGTGHEGAFYFYVWAIPVALLPWWPAAIEGFKPRAWRSVISAGDVRAYWALAALGMALLLSASATKRELYLLPLLPPLFLFLASHAVEAWRRAPPSRGRHLGWAVQIVLCTALAVGPVLAVGVYLQKMSTSSIAFVSFTVAVATATVVFGQSRSRPALAPVVLLAVAGAIGLLGVVPAQLDSSKNMAPFLTWVDATLPQDGIVYAVGRIDETLEGIVPFTTGRKLVALTSDDVTAVWPEYVLAQDADGGANLPDLPDSFEALGARIFGVERYLGLWRSRKPAPSPLDEDSRSHETIKTD
jgi:4-amino-4-deoxy-L-arabinose transferase-like glycosyltransferase